MPPSLSGIHHVTLPVSDLEASAGWYAAVLGATRLPGLDHHDPVGNRFSVVVTLPGLDIPVQLRLASDPAIRDYDPVTLAVADHAALEQWAAHLDAVGIQHGPIVTARIGYAMSLHDRDSTVLRLYTAPQGPLA